MIKEIWKPVVGFEGVYEVSNTGLVRSIEREIKYSRKNYGIQNDEIVRIEPARLMTQRSLPTKHKDVNLRKNGKPAHHLVHRLVAMAFIENPENFTIINHIDGNPENNNVNNLEWCTFQHNTQHYWDKQRMETWVEKTPWKCEQCGKTKLLPPSEHIRKYCSNKCFGKSNAVEKVLGHKSWKVFFVNCKTCGRLEARQSSRKRVKNCQHCIRHVELTKNQYESK